MVITRNTQYKITRDLSQITGAFLDLLIAVASLEALKAFFSLHHRLRADALSDQNKSVHTQTKIDGARAKRVLEQHAAPVPSSFPRFSSTHARSAALVPFRPLSSLSFTLLSLPRWSVSFATMPTRLPGQFSATGVLGATLPQRGWVNSNVLQDV